MYVHCTYSARWVSLKDEKERMKVGFPCNYIRNKGINNYWVYIYVRHVCSFDFFFVLVETSSSYKHKYGFASWMTNVGFIFRTFYEKSGESWIIVACMLSTNPLLLFALGWSRTTRSQTLLAPRGSRREYTLPHSTMANSAIGAIFVWPPCKMPS